jgi:hypothetical protein
VTRDALERATGLRPFGLTADDILIRSAVAVTAMGAFDNSAAARYAPTATDGYWGRVNAALRRRGGHWDGTAIVAPDPVVPDAPHAPLHLPSILLRARGHVPLARDDELEAAVRLASYDYDTARPPDAATCTKCGGKLHDGHYRLCGHALRQSLHHAVVRLIKNFIGATDSHSAHPTRHAGPRGELIPDLTVSTPLGSYLLEIKTSERRGKDFYGWARCQRREVAAKYAPLTAFEAPTVICVAFDGRIDAASAKAIRRIQAARALYGPITAAGPEEILLTSSLGALVARADAKAWNRTG